MSDITTKNQARQVPIGDIAPGRSASSPAFVQRPGHHTRTSVTLKRTVVSRPKGTHEVVVARHKPVRAKVAKSPLIHRFTPVPSAPQSAPDPVAAPVRVMPLAHQRRPATPAQTAAATTSRRPEPTAPKTSPAEPTTTRCFRLSVGSLAAGAVAVLLLAGYVTYLSMPGISMSVAANQAGIRARFPSYRPDGYHFAGPIAYSPGEVRIAFKANGDTRGYSVTQRSSTWDSQAVLDNFVASKSKTYNTFSEQGLTVYAFENKAAWVSGGILYTIDGDAPLSSEQLLRIATSM